MKTLPPWSHLRQTSAAELHRSLRRVVNDARVLGVLFVVVGLWFPWRYGFLNAPWSHRTVTAIAAMVLIAPGVLYLVTAHAMSRHRPHAGRLARCAAAGHVAAILILFGVRSLDIVGFSSGQLLMPALIATFFLPALLSFLLSMGKAVQLIDILNGPGRAFEPVMAPPPKRVIPVDAMNVPHSDCRMP